MMEEERKDIRAEEEAPEILFEEPKYVPRPKWQVWAARIGLVLFILLLIFYYLNIARGGA